MIDTKESLKLLADLYNELKKPIHYHVPPIARVIEIISWKQIEQIQKCLVENGYKENVSGDFLDERL